jgi:thiamine-phosphate pyrophosphorylase
VSLTLKRPLRYLITAGRSTPENFDQQRRLIIETISNAVGLGIELVQIREKHLTPRLLFELAHEAAGVTARSRTRLLINGRYDIAIATGADGVHLTSNSLPTAIVRERTHDNFLIAVSTHAKDEVMRSRGDGADLAVYGPIFFTPDKGEPKGSEGLRDVCSAVGDFPVVALGGIDEKNSTEVIDAGAAGYAAIRYLNDFVNIKQ